MTKNQKENKTKAKKTTKKASVIKKTPAKKRVVKKTNKVKAEKSPLSFKKKLEKSKVKLGKNDTLVTLPKNMSKSSIERTQKLRAELEKTIQRSVYIVTYVSAACFIIVGAAFSLTSVFNNDVRPSQLKAEGISSLTSSDANQDNPEVHRSELSFITDFPNNVTAPFRFEFSAVNFSEIQLQLVNIGGRTNNLNYEMISENKFISEVPQMEQGYYEVFIYAYPKDGSTKQVYSSREFFIGTKEEEDIYNKHESDTDHTTETTVVDVSDDTEKISDTVQTDPLMAEEQENRESDSESLAGGTDTNTIIQFSAQSEEIQEEAEDIEEKKPMAAIEEVEDEVITEVVIEQKKFEIFSSTRVLSGTASFAVTAPTDVKHIELYYRSLNSLDYRFVTLASQRNDEWNLLFDTNDIPNGQYEFIGKTIVDNKEYKTNSLKLTVENEQKIVEVEPTITFETAPVEEPVREFFKAEDSEPVEQDEVNTNDEKDALKEVDVLLKENSSELDSLLERYAVALQSGDEILISSVKDKLDKLTESIVSKTLEDEETNSMSEDIDTQLKIKVTNLTNKVSEFEEVRKKRSEGDTSIDTDKDGVSDYDEKYLYKTDPNLADTDNDGISDGVEITSGFNPLDPKPEAVIAFKSPKESIGLQRSDILVVTATPIVMSDNEGKKSSSRTEIRGTALPNSFVTLYIYSSPTVVTIKTDADGSFVYTFDKELEDGRHDVYVAITDNAGEIVAQSNPFSFIKRAEAFSPVDAEASGVVSSNTIVDSSGDDYITVTGVAILAFGIILLMLGLGLRSKKDEEEDDDTLGIITNISADEVEADKVNNYDQL